MQQIGKYLILIGIAIIIIGAVIYLAGNKFHWFGNLPGDIKIKRDNFSFYAPITSMLLVSAFLSFLFWLISKFKS